LFRNRGGRSPSVTVTSDSPAGVIEGSPAMIGGGSASGLVTLQLQTTGVGDITATAPPDSPRRRLAVNFR